MALYGQPQPKDYAVALAVHPSEAPPSLLLEWPQDDGAGGYTILKISRQGLNWYEIAKLSGTNIQFLDTNVVVGESYEYQIVKTRPNGPVAYGFAYSAIKRRLVEDRGKVLLVIENQYTNDLQEELARWEGDLLGDGWNEVIRIEVSRNDPVTKVKSMIQEAYQSQGGQIKALILFGRVPVPYSGNITPDCHLNHKGAWPADVYYGDMDGTWTDSTTTATTSERTANWNVPGDGKFDQDQPPSDVRLQVGRIDFANMTCFENKIPALYEKDLLRRYLNKDHAFRHRIFEVKRRGIICDSFGVVDAHDPVAAHVWRNYYGFFGASNIVTLPKNVYFQTVAQESALWSFGAGGGTAVACDGIGSADDFAIFQNVNAVFTHFVGSYFGDWDQESNFMRAAIGSSGYILSCAFAGYPQVLFHHMNLGETLGYGIRVTQNNRGMYPPETDGQGMVHIALLGDPTLRMHIVKPPQNPRVEQAGQIVHLTWDASDEESIEGYHVYFAASQQGPFDRLTPSEPIKTAEFLHTNANYSGVYMIKTITLEETLTGSYFNSSQGIYEVLDAASAQTPPIAPSGLFATAVGTNQVLLVWVDNSGNEEGFSIERAEFGAQEWQIIGSVPTDQTSFQDVSIQPDKVYRYRVRAFSAAGYSPPSSETSFQTSAAGEPSAEVQFIGVDDETRGNWKGAYGSDGYYIVRDGVSYPSYLEAAVASNSFDGGSATNDIYLQRASGDGRIYSYVNDFYSPIKLDLKFIDENYHRVSLYLLDPHRDNIIQRAQVFDRATETLLDERVFTNLLTGKYVTWTIRGHVRIDLTGAPYGGLLCGAFFDPVPLAAAPDISPSAGLYSGAVLATLTQTQNVVIRYTLDGSDPGPESISFDKPIMISQSVQLKARSFAKGYLPSTIKTATYGILSGRDNLTTRVAFIEFDDVTQGNWPVKYGSEAFQIANGAVRQSPAISTIGLTGTLFIWQDVNTAPGGLWKTADSSTRTASTWYDPSHFELSLKMGDSNYHRLALYFWDWDAKSREELVEFFDFESGQKIDEALIQNFAEGRYAVWDFKGAVRIGITKTAGLNAVLSGIFLSPSAVLPGNAPPRISVGSRDNQSTRLIIEGSPGQTFGVDVSPDLQSWQTIFTNTFTSNKFEFIDAIARSPNAFYRSWKK